ncbi:sugar ABC transporter permease [Paenibacillus sp. 598K]|uniref:carbohydrate ABC transporter permease n=1 Tax=Paenibacillus sp. 598K TaxID=1117987 RepID=UPI000FF9D9C2|nr:carbohydrate ABC transporter permease [Paenibacillus sp. 598K]GBF74900.1 sugar ABC transporter permease [Paenibacillus sp. 598K]
MKSGRLSSLGITLALIVASLVAVFPVYLAVINSFKTQGEMFESFTALPSSLMLDNYAEAFSRLSMVSSLTNSIIVSILGIGGILLCASLAGYKLSRTSGRLSQGIFYLFIASMMVPFHSIMIPLTRMAKELNVQGSIYGLSLIYIGLGVNMAIFLYHGFVKGVPRELEESAQIDGCNEWQTFFRIIFPLLLPITVTIAILDFLWIWNDFLLPLLMLTNAESYTLIISTNKLFGEYNTEWSLVLAALVLTAIPVVLIFMFFQRYIMTGITEGAVKG